MPRFKKLAVIAVAVFAYAVVGVANASAASFTESSTGAIEGHKLTPQVFETSAGQVKCNVATTTGSINYIAFSELLVEVNYSNCKAFSALVAVQISTAHYDYYANGSVDITEPITVTVPGVCTQTVPKQTVSSVTFEDSGSNLVEKSNVSGISWTGSGGVCGSSGTTGTFTGNNEINRVGGGSLGWDA